MRRVEKSRTKINSTLFFSYRTKTFRRCSQGNAISIANVCSLQSLCMVGTPCPCSRRTGFPNVFLPGLGVILCFTSGKSSTMILQDVPKKRNPLEITLLLIKGYSNIFCFYIVLTMIIFEVTVIFVVSRIILVYYCKCCNVIGYSTRYLFIIR